MLILSQLSLEHIMRTGVMPDTELEAMSAVHDALSPLDEDARGRVLRWAADKYAIANLGSSSTGDDVHDESGDEDQSTFRDVGDLMHAAQAANGPERALAVAYWFQEVEGRDGWGGGELNDALKNLGHGLANVTKTLDSLKARKPALVMQVGKSGRSRQARKTYKLTVAGIREVRTMLARSASEEAA